MRPSIVLAVVLLGASPLAAAWGAKGFVEPDTRPDREDGFMWTTDPPTTNERRVYFNGFLAQGRGAHAECSTNLVPFGDLVANCDPAGGCAENFAFPSTPCYGPTLGLGSGLAGFQHAPYPLQPYAVLGVWRDCNQDGYIGLGDQGLWEYRAELLTTPGVCPRQSDPSRIPRHWYPSHNDGAWVRELLPLGWDQWGRLDPTGAPSDANVYDLNDTQARVWADWGLPDAASRSTCNVTPPPRDTLRQTGGMVEWTDCFLDFRLTKGVNSLDALDATPAGQLTFRDKPYDQSQSQSGLNQRNPWGTNADDPIVETCGGRIVLLGADGSRPSITGWEFGLNHPGFPSAHTDGSLAGQTRESYYHMPWMACDGNQAALQVQASEAPYRLESDKANQVGARRQSDFAFYHYADARPAPPFAGAHRATPDDLGPRALSPNGLWRADGAAALTRPPLVTRETVDLAPVQYITYYASVGAFAISEYQLRLPGSRGLYGAGACAGGGGAGAPERDGWACDPGAWWPGNSVPRYAKLGGEGHTAPVDDPGTENDDPGSDATCRNTGQRCTPIGVRIGHEYALRDVDCFDEATPAQREEGLTLGAITNQRCDY